jgi:hypothetical protein
MFDVPIIFLVFNRPTHTLRTMEVIRTIRPRELFVVADGPRQNVPKDAEECNSVRKLIQDQADWGCQLYRDYSDENLGCARRVSSGISKAFEVFDRAIILEDDLLPSTSFFSFCAENLSYYEGNDRICGITGNNFQRGNRRISASYYFSKYPHCWGWATWRRAWKNFDYDMVPPEGATDGDVIRNYECSLKEVRYWERIFELTRNKGVDSWAYRWLYSCWVRSQLAVLPENNLVEHCGFGLTATHTTSGISIPAEEITEIKHPISIEHNEIADTFTFDTVFSPKQSLPQKLIGKLSLLKRRLSLPQNSTTH